MRYKPCFNEYNGIKEVIKLYNRNIKRSQSFLYNVLGKINFEDVFIETHNLGQNVVEKIHEINQQF